MKRARVFQTLAIVCIVAVAIFGVRLWRGRPWRAVVAVNGHVLTADELEKRAVTLMEDARRVGRLAPPKDGESDSLPEYRRRAAQRWIVKEVLLAEAVARGVSVTADDEKEALARMEPRLKARGITPDQFFREGPLPEEIKRRDFNEAMLINKFAAMEVREAIDVTPGDVDARLGELKAAAAEGKPAPTRQQALAALRSERYQDGFRELFRANFAKAEIRSPEFPELETLDGFLPSASGINE